MRRSDVEETKDTHLGVRVLSAPDPNAHEDERDGQEWQLHARRMVDETQGRASQHETPQEISRDATEVALECLCVLDHKDEIHDERPPKLAQEGEAGEDAPDLEAPQDAAPVEHESHWRYHARR